MNDLLEIIQLVLLLSLIGIEIVRGCYSQASMNTNNKLINVISIVQDSFIVRPLIAVLAAQLAFYLLPQHQGALADAPLVPSLIVMFLVGEFTHYWYHRLAHHWEPLWNFHRVHHSATQMSVMVTSRIHILWQVFMPVNYLAGIALYLGLYEMIAVWFFIRAILNFLTHTNLRWDLVLHDTPGLRRPMWLLERIVTLQDAHHAHHGYAAQGAPMGNYAPVLILWDVIFGTAKFPHAHQEQVGIEDDVELPWYKQLWWLRQQ